MKTSICHYSKLNIHVRLFGNNFLIYFLCLESMDYNLISHKKTMEYVGKKQRS